MGHNTAHGSPRVILGGFPGLPETPFGVDLIPED